MDFYFIEDKDGVNELMQDLLSCPEIGLDTETTSKNVYDATWLLLQLEINDKIYILDVRRLGLDFIKYLINLIKDSKKLVIGHNLKYDNEIIYLNTDEYLENLFDTMLAEVLINSGIGEQFYSLADIVYKYHGVNLSKAERETFENYRETYFTNDQITYSALDVKYLKSIKEIQLQTLKNQEQLRVMQLEMDLIPVVCSMELEGVLLDNDQWLKLKDIAETESKNFETSIVDYIVNKLPELNKSNCLEYCDIIKIPAKTKKLRSELESITDISNISSWIKGQINIGSHTQMLAILRELEKLDVDSSSEKIIKDFKNQSKLVELLLSYREHQKKLTTYGEGFFSLINPKTGRIHVDQNQIGTATGRFAVSRLHQIPRDNRYRNAFIARPGYKIITADLNQAEFRLIGADSGEPEIIDAYKRDFDFHRKTGSIIYNIPYEEVNKDQRYWGKQCNFALVYRVSEFGLYYNFGLPLDKGRELLYNLFKGYPRLKIYMDYLGEKVWEMGYCPTMLGRRRYAEKNKIYADSREFYRYKNRVIRELGNHRIQGTCADIIKIAMLNLFRNNPFGKDNFKVLIQLHDELMIEVKEEIAQDAVKYVTDVMLDAERPYLGEIPPAISLSLKDFWYKD